ncbi:hypothetical protein EON77_13990 [bacterium]|nr:MAG: hypothetical protein EON77_13990 [bacterium]
MTDYLEGRAPTQPNNSLNKVLQFVRAADDTSDRLAAWDIATLGFRAPLTAAQLADAVYVERANTFTRKFYARLYLDDAKARGDFADDPPFDAELTPKIVADLRANLLNGDGARTYETRRLVVDVLKKMQRVEALATLREARALVAAARVTAGGEDAAQLDDLLGRIDRAVSPYFN